MPRSENHPFRNGSASLPKHNDVLKAEVYTHTAWRRVQGGVRDTC